MSLDTNTTRSQAPKRPSFVLGLFVVGQLVFLCSQNLITLLEGLHDDLSKKNVKDEYVYPDARGRVEQVMPGWLDKQGHIWNFMEGTGKLTHRWSQATLQLQQWALFAPNVGTECTFPALLLCDADFDSLDIPPGETLADNPALGRVLLSDNEPADLKDYFRWGNFRLRRLENNLVIYLRWVADETAQERAERWRARIREQVNNNAELLRAYVRWRLQARGEELPGQVVLLMRRYDLKGPDAGLAFVEGPFTLPVARWQPHRPDDPLDVYNPVTQKFEPLRP